MLGQEAERGTERAARAPSQVALHIAPSRDLAALSAVARASFLESFAHLIPWADIRARADTEDSPDGIGAYLAAGATAWLASHPATGAPVGWALLCAPELPEIKTRPTDRELKRIYLLAPFRGGGAGAALLAAVETRARADGAGRLLLGVHHANPAVAWYTRRGFEKVGERRFRVGTSHFHDVILVKPL